MTEEKTWRPKTDHERQIVAAKYAYVAGLIEYDGATDEELRAQRKELREEFTQLIEDVRAAAWDEGAHRVYARNLDEAEWTAEDWLSENPYRKDTA